MAITTTVSPYPGYATYAGSNTYVNPDPGSYYYSTLAQQTYKPMLSDMMAGWPPIAPKKPHKYASLKERVTYRVEYKEWMSQNALWQSDQQLRQEEIVESYKVTPKYYVNTSYPGQPNPYLGGIDSGLGTIASHSTLHNALQSLGNLLPPTPPAVNWSYHISPTGQLTT